VTPLFLVLLRLATVAPDGTAWARELKAFAREVEATTNGSVQVKWVWGGIAGDDVEVSRQIERGRLDGVASGGMLCQRLAPSMRVSRAQGIFKSREESSFVLQRLKETLDAEFKQAGFVNLVWAELGPEIILTRTPVSSLADLKRLKLWRWDLDEVGVAESSSLGLNVVPLPLNEAARGYDDGRIDGFIAVPSAALAFQWSARSHYLYDLRVGYLNGCFVIASRAFDRLPIDQQQLLRSAGAKLNVRFNDVGKQTDEALLGGLLRRQGVEPLRVQAGVISEFIAASKAARDRLQGKLIPVELQKRVEDLLGEYRAQHAGDKRK
jgi:TRAP-type C4-dicarboxylate transport system substrate-binding protein